MSFRTLFAKETGDLLREKRYGAWMIAYAAAWAIVLAIILRENASRNGREFPMGATSGVIPHFFIGGISLVLLALLIASDGLARDRESGTLPLVGATPSRRSHVLLAKLAAVGVAYLGAAALALVVASVMALSLGWPMMILVAEVYALPLVALFAYLAGVGLLVGTVFRSSKAAIAAAAGFHFTTFLLTLAAPLFGLGGRYAWLDRVIELTPFQAVLSTADVLARGGTLPWDALFTSVAIGAACSVAAVALFSRQEAGL